MSHPGFLLILAAGAAFLASWLLARLPEWSPAGHRRALLHFGASLALVWTAGNVIEPLSARGLVPALAGLFLLVLPALVYSWFAVAWILRLFHRATRY
jgi:hypothetical protein